MTDISDMKDTSRETLMALATRLATGSNGLDTALRDKHLATFEAAVRVMGDIGFATARSMSDRSGDNPYYTLTSRWNTEVPDHPVNIGMEMRVNIPFVPGMELAGRGPATVAVVPEDTAFKQMEKAGGNAIRVSPAAAQEVSTVVGGLLKVLGSDSLLTLHEAKFASAVARVLTAGEISRTGTPVQRR